MESYHTAEANFALWGGCCLAFTSATIHCIHTMMIPEMLRLAITNKRPELIVVIVTGLTLAFLGDCWTQRYNIAVVTIFILLVSLSFSSLAAMKWILPTIRYILSYSGYFFITVYSASYGVVLSVFFEQVNMEVLPNYGGYMRKYIFYYLLGEKSFYYTAIFLMKYISVPSVSLITIIAAFFLITTYQLLLGSKFFHFYKAPFRRSVLKECLKSLVLGNVKLFEKNNIRLSLTDMMTVKAILMLLPIIWLVCTKYCGYALRKVITETVPLGTKSKLFYFLLPAVWLVFLPMLELWFIPLIRKHTFLRTSIHHSALAFCCFSLLVVMAAIFKWQVDAISFTLPNKDGYGQLKFYSASSNKLLIVVEKSQVTIKPFGSGHFVYIPVKNSSVQKVVHITELGLNHSEYQHVVKVEEKKSFSHLLGVNGTITSSPQEDPFHGLKTLDNRLSYFYVFIRPLDHFNLTFSHNGKIVYSFRFPSQTRLFYIKPEIYDVTYKGSRIVHEIYNKHFIGSYIYCFVNYANFGKEFFHVTSVPKQSLTIVGLQTAFLMCVTAEIEVSFYYFVHTESPIFLRATIFSLGEVLMIVGRNHLQTYFESFEITVMTLFSLSFFLFCLTLIALNYGMRFKFSHYATK